MPAINQGRTAAKPSSGASSALTGAQKAALVLGAVLVGPALLKKVYEKPDKVDLSSFNIVTSYDVPAIEKMDSTVNGQFKRTAQGLMQQFPGLPVEGGPYTPPVALQYTVRAVRAAQVGVGVFFFFGEQIFAAMRRAPPAVLQQMHDNKLVSLGAVYGLDVIAQTAKSINAFEITYNGHVLHSKLKTGQFPDPEQVASTLRAIMAKEQQQAQPAEGA